MALGGRSSTENRQDLGIAACKLSKKSAAPPYCIVRMVPTLAVAHWHVADYLCPRRRLPPQLGQLISGHLGRC